VSNSANKILIAEDDPTSAFILENILSEKGYKVVSATNGKEAWEALGTDSFDALITDWMMPQMDGITLIREVRANIQPAPVILVVTAIVTPQARGYALDSGADDFITKPYMAEEVLSALENCLARRKQPLPPLPEPDLLISEPKGSSVVPFIGVGIAANTGGPYALAKFFEAFPKTDCAAAFIVLQAPAWALEIFVLRLQKQTPLKVRFAEDGVIAAPGTVYIARKDRHLTIEPDTFKIRLLDSPPENFCRPSADILFRGLSQAFGHFAIALAMTGIGKDGLLGAAHVKANSGLVLVQDPATADAPYLPQTLIELGTAQQNIPLPNLGEAVYEQIEKLSSYLVDMPKKWSSG
jgi:two-component system chemotaxis response regulator CheB